ncbi:MAG: GerMN domain-containing protein, partial [Dehalococcoidia bacterium]|nr:GerMN domain-containing protein [Dehalococcoidia bacterium]
LLLLCIVLVAFGCRPRPATAAVSVYFTRSDGNAITLVEVRRTVPRGATEAMLAAALNELLNGPTAEERARGLSTSIPPKTRVRVVQVRNGVVRADFTREVEAGGGSASMLGRFWQIVYTATQFKDALKVQILIEGQEREAMGGEGVIIGQPVSRPPTQPRF